MCPCTRNCCALLLVLTLPGGAACGAEINPLTGTTLALEQRQRRLDELRVETQMLEEEVKQAELRLRAAGTSLRAVPALRAPGPLPAPRDRLARAPRPARRDASPARQGTAGPAAPATVVPVGPVLQAIIADGERRRALLRVGTETVVAGVGDKVGEQTVDGITAFSVTVGGVVLGLPARAGVIAVLDPQVREPAARGVGTPTAFPRGPGPAAAALLPQSPLSPQSPLPPLAPLPAPVEGPAEGLPQ